jgi:hypothetical protein
MISEDFEGLPIAVYEEGTFFGDIEVFKNFKRYFSVNSLTNLELLALEKKDFKRIFFRQYPTLGHLFLNHIEKKWNNIQEILELIEDFFDPEETNSKGREITKLIKKDGDLISKISRKNSMIKGMVRNRINVKDRTKSFLKSPNKSQAFFPSPTEKEEDQNSKKTISFSDNNSKQSSKEEEFDNSLIYSRLETNLNQLKVGTGKKHINFTIEDSPPTFQNDDISRNNSYKKNVTRQEKLQNIMDNIKEVNETSETEENRKEGESINSYN